MAFLAGNDLVSFLLRNDVIIDDNNINILKYSRVKQAAYELSLGEEVYLTDNETKVSKKLDRINDTININPGQFALLLTEEVIQMTNDKLGFISIKASEKLKGLINVSGFHVDPGFKGKLLFSVYNASPSVIQLRKGEPYFLIWFSELKSPINIDHVYNSKNHQNQNKIDPKYITPLINGEISSPNELSKQIKDSFKKINEVEKTHSLKNEKIFWVVSVFLSLVVAINIACWFNKNEYIRGYNDAVRLEEFDKLIKQNSIILNDSLTLRKIDSLIYTRLNNKDK